MCGIAGVFHHAERAPVDPERLRAMGASLRHRGPDAGDEWIEGEVGLAHRRLSIIDLEGSPQPLASTDGRCVIVFNGEIYNFAELREELQARGRVFRTAGDTEVLLTAYQEWGDACVERLRGMFAFAIWDREHQRLLLARDRLGIKPLYVYDDGRTLAFASELKALHAHGDLTFELDERAVADYFCLLYIPAPKTIWRAARKLEPAHVQVATAGGPQPPRRYWSLEIAPDASRGEEEWVEALRAKLDEVVRLRMVADVPLGAFLSGGTDSSAVVATMARLRAARLDTFSIGFDEEGYDERPHARLVAERYETLHHEQTVRPEAYEALETLAWHFDEPFADSSAIPTWYVSQLARKHVTVSLSGDGGDENFAGYERRYRFERAEDRVRRRLPRFLRRHVMGRLARLYPKADWLPRPLRARTTLLNLALDPHEGFFNTMSLQEEHARDALFGGDFRRRLAGYRSSELFRELMARSASSDPVSRAQYVDAHTFMVDDILTKVDRASMACSLEVRVPLIDHEFMELAATIPSHLNLPATEGKHLFKRALADRVPHEVMHRPKHGFEIPIGPWLKGELKDVARATILGDGPLGEIFERRRLVQLWEEHQSGRRDRTHLLWAILVFRRWAESFTP